MLLRPCFSDRMKHWQIEAYREIGVERRYVDYEVALFPRSFFEAISRMDQTKINDICFVGALKVDERTAKRRRWLIDYVRKNFTERSYLQFTDSKTKKDHVALGSFDFTCSRTGFVPKEVRFIDRDFFDAPYYQVLCHSQFTLCPGGDRVWSMRFYEALMCKSIPILESRIHHRTIREALRGYKFYTVKDELIFRQDWVDHNYDLFLKHHLLTAPGDPLREGEEINRPRPRSRRDSARRP